MNVYDFDGTIFYPNATFKFAVWCILRHPSLLFTYVPRMLFDVVKYKLRIISMYKFGRSFFRYMTLIPDFDKQIEAFWDKNEKNISQWYMKQKKSDDLIISASPECIVKPITNRLGVNLVGTLYDHEMGVFYGNFMLAKNKARFIIEMDMPVIDNFYSDSISDTPLALCSENAYLVTKRAKKPVKWPEFSQEDIEKIRESIDIGYKYFE